MKIFRVQAHNESLEGISVANEYSIDESGKLVIPFGDHPVFVTINGRKERVIQRLDAEAANTMVRDFNSLRQKMARAVFGEVPIYVGHPDVPELASRYPDTRAYAWTKSLKAENNNFIAEPEWSEDGDKMRKQKFYRWPSPRWDMVQIGVENSVKIFRPVHLISYGLTNSPNIPTSPAVNEDPGAKAKHTTEVQMDKFKQFFITLLGLANTATDDEIEGKIRDTIKAANEVPGLKGQITAKDGEIKTEQGKLTAANELLKTERKTRFELLAGQAINERKLTAAQKDERLGKIDFGNVEAFNAAVTEIGTLKVDPTIKTEAKSKDLGGRQAEGANAADKIALIQEAVNEEAAKIKNYDPTKDYNRAVAAARRAKPQLFEASNAKVA